MLIFGWEVQYPLNVHIPKLTVPNVSVKINMSSISIRSLIFLFCYYNVFSFLMMEIGLSYAVLKLCRKRCCDLALLRESQYRRRRLLPTVLYVLPTILYVLPTILYVRLETVTEHNELPCVDYRTRVSSLVVTYRYTYVSMLRPFWSTNNLTELQFKSRLPFRTR